MAMRKCLPCAYGNGEPEGMVSPKLLFGRERAKGIPLIRNSPQNNILKIMIIIIIIIIILVIIIMMETKSSGISVIATTISRKTKCIWRRRSYFQVKPQQSEISEN